MITLSKRALPLLLFALSLLAGCSRETPTFTSKTPQSVSGTVIKIVDGDTINILDSHNVQQRIRLKGIDAPERTQAFYQVSRENLASLLFQKQVRVDYVKVDQFGRLIGKVWIEGNDACLEQIKAGLAWHFKRYETEQLQSDRELYARAEQEVHDQKRGLWQDFNPIPPWDFRRHKTGSIDEAESADSTSSFHHNPHNLAASAILSPTHSTPADRVSMNPPATIDTGAGNPIAVGSIRGNKRRLIYHWPGCPNYDDIALRNRVMFANPEEAEKAGYRAARNCS